MQCDPSCTVRTTLNAAGAVVGVLVAVIALSAVALILVFLLWRRKTRSGVLDIKS